MFKDFIKNPHLTSGHYMRFLVSPSFWPNQSEVQKRRDDVGEVNAHVAHGQYGDPHDEDNEQLRSLLPLAWQI